MSNPPLRPELANTRAWRAAEIPAANGHGNARSVARVMAALACGGTLDGVRLLGRDTIERAIVEQRYEKDLVLGLRLRWGLGFMLTSNDLPLGPNPHTFGHGGWGGSLGFADLDAGVSWAYVMNKMSPGTTGDFRAAGPIAALYGLSLVERRRRSAAPQRVARAAARESLRAPFAQAAGFPAAALGEVDQHLLAARCVVAVGALVGAVRLHLPGVAVGRQLDVEHGAQVGAQARDPRPEPPPRRGSRDCASCSRPSR